MTEGVIIPPVSPSEALDINKLNGEIDTLVTEFKYQKKVMDNTVARIGYLICKVQQNRYWIDLGFSSFGQFIDNLGAKMGLGRTQLYEYKQVVQKLSPYVTEQEMETIGVTRGRELTRYINLTGKRPPNDLIALSKVKPVAELKAAVFLEVHGEPAEKQRYLDLGGFYCTNEERKSIDWAFKTAELAANVSPECSEPERKKQIIIALCQEFLNSHLEEAGTVYDQHFAAQS